MPSAASASTSASTFVAASRYGLELGDLRADVHVDAAHVDRRQRRGAAVESRRVGEGDAELALLEPGRDVRMRLRVDVRIDAEADRRARPGARGDARARRSSSRRRLDVEAEDAGAERRLHLALGLADAREHDLARVAAGGEHARELAAGDDVEAAAEPREESRTARFEFAFIA